MPGPAGEAGRPAAKGAAAAGPQNAVQPGHPGAAHQGGAAQAGGGAARGGEAHAEVCSFLLSKEAA